MKQKSAKTNSIEKALNILMSFAPYCEEMGTLEISQKLGFNKATTSRILNLLTDYGFLQRNQSNKKYILGREIVRLGDASNRFLRSNIVQIAKPYIDQLKTELNETVALEMFSRDNSLMTYISQGPQQIPIVAEIGEMLPKHAAAGAKVVLAFLPSSESERIIQRPLQSWTPNTITDPIILFKQLHEFRETGVSIDREEVELGVSGVGAPIFDRKKKPVGAVVVVGFTENILGEKKSSLISKLKSVTGKISAQLFYIKGNNQK